MWRVLVLEGVPRLLRSLVTASIKRGIPQPMHGRTLKLYRDSRSWKERLGLRSVDSPCVVLIDAAGTVRWLRAAVVSRPLLTELQEAVERLLAQPVSPR